MEKTPQGGTHRSTSAEKTTRGMGTELLKYTWRSWQRVLFSSPLITARPTDADSWVGELVWNENRTFSFIKSHIILAILLRKRDNTDSYLTWRILGDVIPQIIKYNKLHWKIKEQNFKKCCWGPGQHGCWLGIVLCAERLLAHARVVGSIPAKEHAGGSWSVSFSLHLSKSQ